MSHLEDSDFRQRSYAAAIIIHETGSDRMILKSFLAAFAHRFSEMLTEKMVFDMKHALKVSSNDFYTTHTQWFDIIFFFILKLLYT